MPWKLIQFIVLFVLFLFLVAFNLENKCDISFGFAKIPNVPVFMTAFTAFLLGMLCALPYIISFRNKIRRWRDEDDSYRSIDRGPERKPWKPRSRKTKAAETAEDSSFSDGGPYGVN